MLEDSVYLKNILTRIERLTGKTKIFNIYEHGTYGIKSVKKGFSWPAFFFSFIWVMKKKLWVVFWLYSLIYILMSLKGLYIEEYGTEQFIKYKIFSIFHSDFFSYLIISNIIGFLIYMLIPGIFGNKWLEKNLVAHGYKFISCVKADSTYTAIDSYKKISIDPKSSEDTIVK